MFDSDLVYHFNPVAKKRGRPSKPKTPTGRVTSYNIFMKENMDIVKHLPNNQRMAEIAKLWKSFKSNKIRVLSQTSQ